MALAVTKMSANNMKLRCSPGDLAIVLNDEPGCEINLGKIVEVTTPLKYVYSKHCWRVYPVNAEAWAYYDNGETIIETLVGRYLHPDTWLMPIGRKTEIKELNKSKNAERNEI